MQVKCRPRFDLPKFSASVCFRCFLPLELHGTLARPCPLGEVIPHLLFLIWIHHRNSMIQCIMLPEVDEDTTFPEYWSMLKLPDDESFPNLTKYIVWAVAHLGFTTLGYP